MRTAQPRSGFVLLAVLWMLAGGAILGVLLIQTARDAQGTARNRVALTRAHWIAEGCIERARAAADEAMQAEGDSVWSQLNRFITSSSATRGCILHVTPAGMTVDVNTAEEAQLRRLFGAAAISAATGESLAAAVLDWRDSDDLTRAAGAERAWYEAQGRVAPSNGMMWSRSELALVRGMESHPEAVELLGVEPERILLPRAPLSVIATLPAVTPTILSLLAQRRSAGDSVMDVTRLTTLAPPNERENLVANLSALEQLATGSPDGWTIEATAASGAPAVSVRLELRVVRSGRRLAIMRRRSDS